VRPPAVFAAEGRLETTSVRLAKMPDMCMAPQLVAQELLREEGFTDVQYIDTTNDQLGKAVAAQANAVIANQNNTASLRSRSQNPAASNAQSSAAAPNMCRESTWIA